MQASNCCLAVVSVCLHAQLTDARLDHARQGLHGASPDGTITLQVGSVE